MKKSLAVFVYLIYAVSITLMLCFGRDVALGTVKIVRDIVNMKDIEDVTVDIDTDTELLASKTYYLDYIAHGDFTGEAGLKFESLNPELLKVTSSGAVYAYNSFEGDSIELSYRITSKYDETFEKIQTLTFHKKYPEKFSAAYSLEGVGSSKTLYVGVPVYVYSNVAAGQSYNVSAYEVLYDEEYFSYDEKRNAYIPIKTTEGSKTLTFAVSYANGSTGESTAFKIAAVPTEVTDFDEIRLNNKPSDGYDIGVNKSILVSLYKDGKRLVTDYTLTLGEGDGGKINRAGRIQYTKSGIKTVTVILPNGFSKTVSFSTSNVMSLPTVSGVVLNDDGVIELLDSDELKYKVSFPKGVTYSSLKFEYDKTLMKVSYSEKTLKITPKGAGRTSLKIVLNDGYQRLEESYELNIIKDTRISTWILKNLGTFITKFFGHMLMFAGLALFSLNMFRFIKMKNPIKRFLGYTMTALPIAALTEFIQYFIPKRTSAIRDVFIDMLGFYLGTAIIIGVVTIVRIIAFGKRTVYRTGKKKKA